MKYIAQVTTVLSDGIHTIGAIDDGTIRPIADLPLPSRIEIVLEGGPSQPCMMFRYTNIGDFCGDTWHANLEDAYFQAAYEYGLCEQDFRLAE